MDEDTLRAAERALSVGTWIIVAGAVIFSVLTVTPLVLDHTPDGWAWTAPILPLVVDAAVVIVVRLDAALARVGGSGGAWPVLLRWMTGLMTLGLNTAGSALKADWVGVAVHSVAPLLLIVSSEAGLAYRRALAAAVTRREAEQRREKEAREQRERERERREREERQEALEREERREREAREHAARVAREEREHTERLAREQSQREREHQTRELEQQRRERERREREREQRRLADEARQRDEAAREAAREQQRLAREQSAREAAEHRRQELLAAGPPAAKLPEHEARERIEAAFTAGLSVRQAADLTGWSVGWVNTRYNEHRDAGTPVMAGDAS